MFNSHTTQYKIVLNCLWVISTRLWGYFFGAPCLQSVSRLRATGSSFQRSGWVLIGDEWCRQTTAPATNHRSNRYVSWSAGLIIVHKGGDWAAPARPGPVFAAVRNLTAHPSTASVPITMLLYNGPLLCGFNVPIMLTMLKRYAPPL